MPVESRAHDYWNIHRVSSTRELIRPNTNNHETLTLALYGGLDYDTKGNQHSGIKNQKSHTAVNTSETTRGELSALRGNWSNLTWSLPEVCSIDSIVQTVPHVSSKKFIGNDGTEESFYSLAGENVNVIHFSTHGFYYDELAVEDRADEKEKYRFMIFDDDNNTFVEDKSMTRCGLLFSGANIALKEETLTEGVEDGILTAQEIATTNFKDLDLVVLAACETALGNVSSEGVYGLQRGFKKAGAKAILMSLWSVPDKATSILMQEFYKNYLNGKSKSESLKIAQKLLIDNSEYSRAENWAGWILLDALD